MQLDLERDILPDLQKQIVKTLAEHGALTIMQTREKISKHYAATHRAFQSLKRKQIIKEVSTKNWKGRKYPQYWLTVKGMLAALILRASPTKMLMYASKIYPNNKEVEFLLKSARYVNPDIFRIPYAAMQKNERMELEQPDLLQVAAIQMAIEPDEQNLKALAKLLQEYHPQHYANFLKKLEKAIKLLTRIKAKLEKESSQP